jgi:hypothetical protein
MRPSITNVLQTTRTSMAAATGLNVALGNPDDSIPGLYIFAHQFVDDATAHRSKPLGTQETTPEPICLDCLLMASPRDDFEALDEGLRCLRDQSILKSGNITVRVTLANISTEALALIFTSMPTTYRLVVPFRLEGS